MLAECQRFTIDIPQRDECRDSTLALSQKDSLASEVRDIVGERSNRRRQLQSLHSRISVSPIRSVSSKNVMMGRSHSKRRSRSRNSSQEATSPRSA